MTSGYLLHGSNETEVDEFRTRANFDAHNTNRVDAVFASDDAIWPLYFAVVKRPQSLINWCEHVPGASRYLFSIGSDPRDPASWTAGTVYLLPRETFTPTPGSRELISLVPVRPRARLTIEPGDFPFKDQTRATRRRVGAQGRPAERAQAALTSLIRTVEPPGGRLVIQIR